MDTRLLFTAVTATASAVLLAGCGSAGRATSAPASHASSRPSGHATSASDSPSNAADAGAIYSLTASQVKAAVQGTLSDDGGAFHQTSSDLFMKAPGTSQRYFQSTGGGYELELDVLPDARPDDSAATYSKAQSYTSADLSNVVHSTPSIGNQADEYTGIAQANNAIVGVDAVSFREGATVGLVFLSAGDGKAHSDAGEAIARALAQHVSSVAYPSGPCGNTTCVARFEGTTYSSVVQFDLASSGWYETAHFTYPVSSGASCELESWSYRGPKGSVGSGDPENDLSLARAASGEQEYLEAGHYVLQLSTTHCFWRIVVQPTKSPFG